MISTLLLGGLNLGKGSIVFTWPVGVNVVVVLLLALGSAFHCLRAITLRRATVPRAAQLRDQWAAYAGGGLRGLVHAQIAHAYLGGDEDLVADAKSEADSRAKAYKKAVIGFGLALLAVAGLTAQALLQQVGGG